MRYTLSAVAELDKKYINHIARAVLKNSKVRFWSLKNGRKILNFGRHYKKNCFTFNQKVPTPLELACISRHPITLIIYN